MWNVLILVQLSRQTHDIFVWYHQRKLFVPCHTNWMDEFSLQLIDIGAAELKRRRLEWQAV